ncbi:DUF5605 domain-containing protein [Streptomyces sp. 11-1-2]|uniref:DUF5605 domain-containing protein n=1 Tax=unclassified Streptomyces TaxID=2593676 RepID=UPI000B8DA8A0|nr:DUF5605 domain-containing protein [Streptomyces sp. 11-1-2]ASQ93489.1 DUF5060 domain-containing protein [Streptomyces sp. 11-1-2]
MRHDEHHALWDEFEIELDGPSHGNPFTDVELAAMFSNGRREVRAGGFYDGDGTYRIRFMPDTEGPWTFVTSSSAPSLDGLSGRFVAGPPAPGRHGPVRVADRLHFAYADGTRYVPLGTTAYAWTHQVERLRAATRRTLASSGFNKVRMCLLPKAYAYNTDEPELYPFPGSPADGWDTSRFDPRFFRRFEEEVRALRELGIEADVILFHPYDRWGFADLGREADDRLTRYAVRRLSAFSNVWWSMANEYDLVRGKTEADWERLAGIVTEEVPSGHLASIHNCFDFYDHTKPWITHCSIQRVDAYRTAENTNAWRERWGKPVVVDECGYEGDIDLGWGNLTGEELVRRCWEGAVRGGYVQHGETYLNDAEELWWSKGGKLTGSSPERIAFLHRIVRESPTGVLDPLPSDWDVARGGVAGAYEILYFGFGRPRFRNIAVPEGGRFAIDVIDTWAMTVDRVGVTEGNHVRVALPGRPYMAVRLSRLAGALHSG